MGSTNRWTVRGAAASAAIVVTVTAAGCSGYNDDRGKGDAPVGTRHEAPRQVWQNLDGFPNVAAFCVGVNGVYTTTREAAPVVVPEDPNCAEGGILADG